MANCKKLLLLTFSSILHIWALAQSGAAIEVEKKEFMRSDGKIWVVMVVVITILAGLIFYISRLDRKISRLEKGGSH